MKQRCFVGFFGLTRGLTWTIDSIEKNVYAPLQRAGLDVVRAAHFNAPQTLQSPRSDENDVPFTTGNLDRLKLDRVVIEPQSEDNIRPYLDAALAVPFRDEGDATGLTRTNALHQLYSLRGLSRLFETMDPDSYSIVILLRPDLRYLEPLPMRQILARLRVRPNSLPRQGLRFLRRLGRPEADIVVPNWQSWGGYNDRFAFATPQSARIYMNRIENVRDFCAARSYFHPETLVKFSLVQAGLRVTGTWVFAERVRSHGAVSKDDLLPDSGRPNPSTLSRVRRALQV